MHHALANPFLDIAPRDCVDLDALEAQLSDALFNLNLTADPEPPPGPSDTDEIEAILTTLYRVAA